MPEQSALMAIDGGRDRLRPGSRILISHEATPTQWEEKLLLWPLASDRWIAYSANGYSEHISFVGHYTHDVTGRASYPSQVVQLQQFAEAVDDGVLRGLVSDAKAEGQSTRLLIGEVAPREPTWFYTWDGEQVAMPGMIYRMGRRAVGKVGPPPLAAAQPLLPLDGVPINRDETVPEVVPGETWVVFCWSRW